MNRMLDKGILLLYCMLILAVVSADAAFVLAFFLAVAVSSFLAAADSPKTRCLLCCLYLTSLMLLPESCFFLPLLTYDFLSFPLFQEKPLFSASARMALFILTVSAAGARIISTHSRASFFFLLTGCLAAALLRFRTDTQESLLHRYRQTRDDDTELQLLLEERNRTLLEKQNNEIYTATLRERNRIAREIHDNVGHMLTRSILMVGALRAVNQDSALAEPLSQLNDTLNQAMNHIRQSVHDLHDSSVNLQEALEALIREFTCCPVSLQYAMSPEIPRELKYSLISIAKESLVNISRHSHATLASISVIEHPGFYQFVVEDNGVGAGDPFQAGNAQELPPEASGIGLANMKARIEALHGTILFSTENGFRIHITVPK